MAARRVCTIHIIVPAYKETQEALNICRLSLETLYPDSNTTFVVDTPSRRRGKGAAIKRSLQRFTDNLYTDVDLAVNPYNFAPMVQIAKERQALVIAKRIPLNRNLMRTTTSSIYNSLVRLLFRTGVSDHQCGCKALSREAVKVALDVDANGFFFDTELIIRCKKAGVPVIEYPVVWVEHKKNSTVNVAKDGWKMFCSLVKLRLFL